MDTFVLQDWTTILGGVATVTQGESSYLDLLPYQDLFVWIDMQTNGPTITVQTSPVKDDIFFRNLISPVTMVAGTLSVVPAFMETALATASYPLVPLARYLRWQVSGTPSWSASFRIVVAAHSLVGTADLGVCSKE